MDNQVAMYDKRYPNGKKDDPFVKLKLNFTRQELVKITSLDNISQMGRLADVLINSFMSGEVLKRVKIANTPDTGILYDLSEGVFYVYAPKKKEPVGTPEVK